MDLLNLLRTKAESIPFGEHSRGLSAVLLHIEAAFGHLERGQTQGEETAYTDAIYRTNLAFEGGVKEAYRVLAQQDPSKKRPFEIEKYLESGKILRRRILTQFTTYRTDWRNPSSHDYTLDFDEGEALLAIVSVSAFVYVLLDEIAEKLAADASRVNAESRLGPAAAETKEDQIALLEKVTRDLQTFAKLNKPEDFETESQLLGAIRGFLTFLLPDSEVLSEFDHSGALKIDLLVKRKSCTVFVEVKRSTSTMTLRAGINQLYAFAEALNSDGILFIWGDSQTVHPQYIAHPSHRLAILSSFEQTKSLREISDGKPPPLGSIFCKPISGIFGRDTKAREGMVD